MMMKSHIQDCGINEVVFVLGYLQEHIKDYVKTKFPDLNACFVTNDKYAETNTVFSLMLSKDLIKGAAFVKFDADVVFDKEILEKLIECEIDTSINLEAEEIKVIVDDQNRVVKANKTVNPQDAVSESIGIEKISGGTAVLLFAELKILMEEGKNHQAYYEAAYERLIEKDVPFYALDISGFKGTEIDTKEDFITAEKIYSQNF